MLDGNKQGKNKGKKSEKRKGEPWHTGGEGTIARGEKEEGGGGGEGKKGEMKTASAKGCSNVAMPGTSSHEKSLEV